MCQNYENVAKVNDSDLLKTVNSAGFIFYIPEEKFHIEVYEVLRLPHQNLMSHTLKLLLSVIKWNSKENRQTFKHNSV